MYLAVVYQDWVVVSVYTLVGAIFKEGLILCNLKVLHPSLLVIEGVQLVFRKVVHDAGSVRVANDIDWGAETISVSKAHTQRQIEIFLTSVSVMNKTGRTGLQQPVHSHQEADVLRGQPDGSQDQYHGHQSSAGNTGCSHTGQCGCHAAREARVNCNTVKPSSEARGSDLNQ